MTSETPCPQLPDAAADRHALAVRQSLRWAELAAADHDYANALSWLAVVEVVDGDLPRGWDRRRREWERASGPGLHAIERAPR